MAAKVYKLPALPYSLEALEPVISFQIMDLHYNKHHNTYVTNLNDALKTQAEAVASNNLVKQLELQSLIKFHAGGHINHTLFWENLEPPTSAGSSESSAPELSHALSQKYGSYDAFVESFTGTALALQGSGWVWLVRSAAKSAGSGAPELSIVTTKDQDLVPTGTIPVFGVDMWEHAYYLQYLNNKKSYVDGVWNVINWKVAEKRFTSTESSSVYGTLAGLVGKI